MTDMELILLFKEDSEISDHDWKRFCRRYAGKDITSVVDIIKEMYNDFEKIPKSLKNDLQREIKKTFSV